MSVRVEKRGPVTTVVLSRPEVRNAVDGPTARALAEAFREIDGDAEANVAVLWGEGGTFCAGADLKALGTDRSNRVDPPSAGASAHDVSHSAEGPMGPTRMRLSKPVIAAISGHAVAGGLELAIWCDLRVAEEDAVLGVFSRRWGVPLIDGGTVRLPRLIGESRAADLILTGRAVSAPEAREMGLVNRVVPPGRAREAAEELAAQIAGFPQDCLRHDRMSLLEQRGLEEDVAIAGEFRHGRAVLDETGLTGVRRFQDGAGRHGSFDR
ncbi:crotonase/enoyl-CoA hydratase family protein [Actinoallomurus purpureus]|uniref:crotonase/enoyl-CoA hydratase family protein n=1 Tax=Actinoallomurus purpureus TaxID=478114 RepID=UPI002092D358|nr:crotonase/enoyl-CoA hydratase family protein [Actinoallomurus purpureus]MCO6004461.1 crotonase/enoyl-CoA hydratase family protein [Actinoallomurus purpureus]